MVSKIISGGQTGADKGGLLAGTNLGLQTGGTAPPNFMTENGPDPSLKDFGLVEGEPDPKTYPKRTERNVNNSDGTLLMGNLSSPGSRLTLRLCRKYGKTNICNPTPFELKSWIEFHNIGILNVAGNRESVRSGIQKETFQLLYTTLKKEEGERCGAYSEHWKDLEKPEGWLGCSLPKGHEGNHSDK